MEGPSYQTHPPSWQMATGKCFYLSCIMAIMNKTPRTADRDRPGRLGHLAAICLISARRKTSSDLRGKRRKKEKRGAEMKLFNCAIKCTFVTFCATSVPCAGVDADPRPQLRVEVEVGTGNSIVEIIITLGRARMRDSLTLSLCLELD